MEYVKVGFTVTFSGSRVPHGADPVDKVDVTAEVVRQGVSGAP